MQAQPQSEAQAAAAPEPPRELLPFDGVRVHIAPAGQSYVELQARTCLTEGYLEQIACAPNSREHESLMVVKPTPSQVHAALLMAGFTPGSPGRWTYDNETLGTIPPTGDQLAIEVRFLHPDAGFIEMPVRHWIREAVREQPERASRPPREFPDLPWVFAGSRIAPNPPFMGPGEHYVADMTGSIIGLVTFGDEVIGFSRVMSDQEEVRPLEWEVNTPAMPPIDTPVTIILKPFANRGP
jgi:hypothetical protein